MVKRDATNPAPTARATMKDVSRLASVSQATVSNYFNRPESVSDELSQRIGSAVDQLGYVRDESARSLRAGSNPTIARIVFEASNPMSAAMGDALERICRERGVRLLTANSGGLVEREQEYLQLFEAQRVTGIVISPNSDIGDALLAIRSRGTPCVLDGSRSNKTMIRSASYDDVSGGHIVGQHLIEQGCKKIAFVGGPFSLPQVQSRLEGLSNAIEGNSDYHLELLPINERTISKGREIGRQLLARSSENLPDGIFAVNDLVALGIMQILITEGGIAIPEQILVAGYDNSGYALTAAIPLTSVKHPESQYAEALFDLLLDDINEVSTGQVSPDKTRLQIFQPQLVVRRSTER